MEVGTFAEGQRYGEEALRLAMLEGRGPHSVRSLTTAPSAALCLTQGVLEHAIRIYDQGLPLRLCLRQPGSGCDPSQQALGYAPALRGRLAEGRALLEEAISEGIRIGANGRIIPAGSHGSSRSVVSAGHDDEPSVARAPGARPGAAVQGTRERGATRCTSLVSSMPTPLLPMSPRPKPTTCRPSPLPAELGMRPLQAHYHRDLGTLYARIGRRERARTELGTAIEFYRAMDMTFWLPQAEAALAQIDGAEEPEGGIP